jgi:hypothetical protein
MMARETADATIDEAVALAAELGLDGIDIHLSGMDRDPERVKRLRWDCLRKGLTIGYAGSGSQVGPPEDRDQRLQQGRADIDTAALMGAQLVRVFARHKWPDTVEEQERLWAPMVDSFQQLADYAGERGVVLGLQNHDESSFCMTAEQAQRILRDVGRDNFGFLMDTGQWKGAIGSHPRGESDPDVDLYEDYLRPMTPHTIYVRAKIYKIDGGREEWIDYHRVAQMLHEAWFNGTLGLTFELGDRNELGWEECVRLAVKHLRQVLRDVQAPRHG